MLYTTQHIHYHTLRQTDAHTHIGLSNHGYNFRQTFINWPSTSSRIETDFFLGGVGSLSGSGDGSGVGSFGGGGGGGGDGEGVFDLVTCSVW